tara:strand:+ start:684 stop:1322 length:639 start_codon:yes stop_codon:yes gene_type:complete
MPLALSDAASMQARIRQIVDREDTAYFSADQLNEYIEMAVDEFLQQYYTIFEANQDARDKLESLVKTESKSFASSAYEVAVSTLADSGDDTLIFYRLLSARLTDSPNTSVKIIQLSDYSAYTNDPFNKADDNNPVIYQEGGKLKVLGLSSTTSIDLTYLQYTSTFSDLAGHTYEELCQIAARKILQTLGDPRYSLMQAEVLERNTALGGRSK